ncbi:MAG TPA: outer membrane lipoprotein-sorting protein [Bryobacteraceae bacterium]|nr:outer membrane lipoprotein-sorting protein [Bryobacteraceae bacterium]
MNRVGVFLLMLPLAAQDVRQIVTESQNRGRSKSERYEGTLEVINIRQKVSTKRWEFERLGSYGDSKALLRFTAPPEVKGVALLVINHADRASDQWMWIPAEERDRRVAMQDRSQRFFGTDFSFEDLEERDVNQFDYKLLGDDTLDGASCWKVESQPKQSKSSQYTSSMIWIRKENYVVVRIDNFTKDKMARRVGYSDLQKIDGIWTPRNVEVFDASKNSRTVLKLDKIEYNVPMKDENFTRDSLRR